MRLALVLALWPLPALACVTAEDAVRGVTFTRADGHVGQLTVSGDETVIDYDTGREGPVDARHATFGVFETSRVLQEGLGIVVGSAPPYFTWKYAPRPKAVTPGGGWSGTIRGMRDDVGYGDQMMEMHNRIRWMAKATFAYLPTQEVRISGCPYEVVPVEAVFEGDQRASQRWLWFPALGFAIETIRDGKRNGITAMKVR